MVCWLITFCRPLPCLRLRPHLPLWASGWSPWLSSRPRTSGSDHLVARRGRRRSEHGRLDARPPKFSARARLNLVDHHFRTAFIRIEQRRRGHDDRILDRLGDNRDANSSARLEPLARIGELHPNFNRGRAGVDRRTHHRDLARQVSVGSGTAPAARRLSEVASFTGTFARATTCEMSTIERIGPPLGGISPG